MIKKVFIIPFFVSLIGFVLLVSMDSVIKILGDWKNFAWFDVCPDGINLHSRFQYRYKNSGGIILGIKTFKDCYDFTTKDKTVKKQKRNDYESSDSGE